MQLNQVTVPVFKQKAKRLKKKAGKEGTKWTLKILF